MAVPPGIISKTIKFINCGTEEREKFHNKFFATPIYKVYAVYKEPFWRKR
jgi:hypothetical protein